LRILDFKHFWKIKLFGSLLYRRMYLIWTNQCLSNCCIKNDHLRRYINAVYWKSVPSIFKSIFSHFSICMNYQQIISDQLKQILIPVIIDLNIFIFLLLLLIKRGTDYYKRDSKLNQNYTHTHRQYIFSYTRSNVIFSCVFDGCNRLNPGDFYYYFKCVCKLYVNQSVSNLFRSYWCHIG